LLLFPEGEPTPPETYPKVSPSSRGYRIPLPISDQSAPNLPIPNSPEVSLVADLKCLRSTSKRSSATLLNRTPATPGSAARLRTPEPDRRIPPAMSPCSPSTPRVKLVPATELAPPTPRRSTTSIFSRAPVVRVSPPLNASSAIWNSANRKVTTRLSGNNIGLRHRTGTPASLGSLQPRL